jgi:hypothetical protein
MHLPRNLRSESESGRCSRKTGKKVKRCADREHKNGKHAHMCMRTCMHAHVLTQMHA